MPQRTGHEIVGKLVRTAMERGCRLADLSQEEFSAAHPSLDARVYEVLGPQAAVRAFVSYGSTAPAEVARQVEAWQRKLGI
ncbi:MAG: hypothetical protein QM775_31595 [Pirellulales bacterium]